MKKIPVYVNPYDKVHFGPSTVMTLHRFGIFDPGAEDDARLCAPLLSSPSSTIVIYAVAG
jgi:hypothetical protein